jgi:hypothetical protein
MCWPVSRAERVCHKCFVLIESCTSTCMCWLVLRDEHDLVSLTMIQHVLNCIELSVRLHVSSHFESRVCNFMCLDVSKSWPLLHGMVCIGGFACRCGMHLCVPSAELVSLFAAMY